MLRALFKRKNKKPSIGLTIGGGGFKAFYAFGVAEVLLKNGLEFCSITGTSAGAAVSLGILMNDIPKIMENCCAIADTTKSKFKIEHLLQGKNPFAYKTIYEKMFFTNLDMKKLHQSKIKIAFNALEFPEELSSHNQSIKRSQIVLSLIKAYSQENQSMKKHEYVSTLAEITQKYNLKEKVFYIDKKISMETLKNIVIACSCVPPFVPFPKLGDHKYYLDGGFHDNVPVKNHDETLDLIIAIYYKAVSKHRSTANKTRSNSEIFYVYPDRVLPISTWDNPNRKNLTKVYELGLESGDNLMRLLKFKKNFFSKGL